MNHNAYTLNENTSRPTNFFGSKVVSPARQQPYMPKSKYETVKITNAQQLAMQQYNQVQKALNQSRLVNGGDFQQTLMQYPSSVMSYSPQRGPGAHHKRLNTAEKGFSEPYFNQIMGQNTRMMKGADMIIRGSTLNQTPDLTVTPMNNDIKFTRTQNKIDEIGELKFWKYQSRRASAKSSLTKANPEEDDYNFIKPNDQSRQSSIEPRKTGQRVATEPDDRDSVMTNTRPQTSLAAVNRDNIVSAEKEIESENGSPIRKIQPKDRQRVFKIIQRPKLYSKRVSDEPEALDKEIVGIKKQLQIGNHWQAISNKNSYRTKQTDWWTVYIRMPGNHEDIWKIIKNITFSESTTFTQPKVNACKPDRNKNEYAQDNEISYSSTTWFPEILYIRINFVKGLDIKPIDYQHILYLKKGGAWNEYDFTSDTEKYNKLTKKVEVKKHKHKKK